MLFALDPAATYLSMTVRHGRGASGHWPFLPLPAFSSSAALLLPLAAGSSAVSPAPCAGLPAWKIHRSQSHRKKAPLGCFLSVDPAATYLSMTVRHGRGASGHWPFLPLPAFSSSAALLLPLAAGSSAVSPAPCAGLPAWKIHRSQSHRKKAPLGCFLSVDPAATYLSMPSPAQYFRRIRA